MQTKLSIPEYFSGKTIVVTGATGFIGQLLIEKILRGCPKVKRIFLFIRPKKGVNTDDRFIKITNLPVFSRLKSIQPNFEKKLQAVYCDFEKENFGIDDEVFNCLKSEVNLVFHSAATVKFDEHLRSSYHLNAMVVRRLLNMCRELSQLDALIHISTAYSFCNHNFIEEEVYPTGWDHDKLHNAMQWMTDDMITKLTPDIIGDRPNTYTLTKAFGEEFIVKYGADIPVCIIRPSIIGPTYKDPMPGWCVNVYGPTGLFIAFAKGFLRVFFIPYTSSIDLIPADFVVNGIIAAAWKTAISKSNVKKSLDCSSSKTTSKEPLNVSFCSNLHSLGYTLPVEPEVLIQRRKSIAIYHFVANTGNDLPLIRICEMVRDSFYDYPLDNAIRFPSAFVFISNKSARRVMSFFLEYLPAFFLDICLMLLGKKRKLLRLTRQMTAAVEALDYFKLRCWKWSQKNTKELANELTEQDKQEFCFDITSIDWKHYIKNYCLGARQYILKEDPKGYPAARRHMWRLRVFGWFYQFFISIIVWKFLISRSGLWQNFSKLFTSTWLKLLRIFNIVSLAKSYL